ncbi:MAG: dUTP diphosphatase [Candidatus Pacebacteria bacterium]|jgi:dUTP pyrophosphatase|nr:dUTP diphosphatase [Candidatus Paceibacterota bacterium]
MQIKFKKLNENAIAPKYAYKFDAGMDLFCLEDVSIAPNERVQISTGIAMEIPEKYVGLIWDKSGLSHKSGLKTVGGVVDSQYRGEIKVGMINLSGDVFKFEAGQKIAQMLIQKVKQIDLIESAELSDTDRGEGGFGSTGK